MWLLWGRTLGGEVRSWEASKEVVTTIQAENGVGLNQMTAVEVVRSGGILDKLKIQIQRHLLIDQN